MFVRKAGREERDHKKVLQISLKSDIYKLSVFRYLNHVLFGASQKYYVFKSLDKFETSQKKIKISKGRTNLFYVQKYGFSLVIWSPILRF